MKTMLVIFAVACITFNLRAQNLSENEVPAAVKEKFSSMYPAAKNVKWEKEAGVYEAEFLENKTETSALFNADGSYLQKEVEISAASLPAGVHDYVTKNLKAQKISEAAKITSAAGAISYEAEVDKSDYLFDADGNFLNREQENQTDDEDE